VFGLYNHSPSFDWDIKFVAEAVAEDIKTLMFSKNCKFSFEVDSFGVSCIFGGDGPSEEAVRCLEQEGIDISDHRSKSIGKIDFNIPEKPIKRIICMQDRHKNAIWSTLQDFRKRKRLHIPVKESDIVLLSEQRIPDPIGRSQERYNQMLETIRPCVKRHLNELSELIGYRNNEVEQPKVEANPKEVEEEVHWLDDPNNFLETN